MWWSSPQPYFSDFLTPLDQEIWRQFILQDPKAWYESYAGATADYYKRYMDKDPHGYGTRETQQFLDVLGHIKTRQVEFPSSCLDNPLGSLSS